MKNKTVNLPIFPLSVFLLPEGITRLRIFEPRYLKMIGLATKGQGFVIYSNSKEEQSTNKMWGSWVEIINFDQGKDGILEVDVKCKSLVEIFSIDKGSDNLHFGNVTYLEHWAETKVDVSISELSKSLLAVFENNHMLNELYAVKRTDNAGWVVARWLELLPDNDNSKNIFIDKTTFGQAKNFVQDIIYK
jgi:Lon protease-like protein